MYAIWKLHPILGRRNLIIASNISNPKSRRPDQLLMPNRRNSGTNEDARNPELPKPQQNMNYNYGGGSLSIGIVTAACMGALWFNNWSLSLDDSDLNKAFYWDPIIKSRIDHTYNYLGSSVVMSALVSSVMLASSTVIGIIARRPLLTATISYSLAVGSHEYIKKSDVKSRMREVAWIGNCASLSPLMIATWKILGPPVLRAYLYALCILGSLSITAMTAPSRSIFETTAPVSAALGVITCGSIGGRYFLIPSTYLLLNMKGVVITAGLALFCFSLLRDKTLDIVEEYPILVKKPYDPLNAGVQIYMNNLNLIGILPVFNGRSD